MIINRMKKPALISSGIDTNSVHGYLLYSPERNELFVSTHVTFHEHHSYDGKYTDEHAFDNMHNASNLHYDDVAKYKYLEGTNHIDPDDGLLYKIISVEEQKYPGQGTYIVGYRAYVYPNGKVSLKPSKEAFHIRDLESYYHENVKSVKPLVNENM